MSKESPSLRTLAGCLVALLVCGSAGCGRPGPERAAEGRTPGAPTGIRYLAVPDAAERDFAYVTAPPVLEFPADHAAHPRYRTEWWYFTGHLAGESGGRYGFELTFFRYALTPHPPKSESAWATNQIWMAHLAVTDVRAGRLIAEERLTRGALGLAGAEAEPLRVAVESWSITALPGDSPHAFALDARGERIGLQLELRALKPPVLHGDDGMDRKGPEAGNASAYYSLTRLAVRGTVGVEGETEAVEGQGWMDREWSTSALSPDVEGWDWFALQLEDGRDLMLYRLRRADGTTSPFSGGSLVDADGARRAVSAEELMLEPLGEWRSPRTGVRYPTAWRVRVPPAELDLVVQPLVDDQEILLSVRYWEGAVRAAGTASGMPIEGVGYLELAGYR